MSEPWVKQLRDWQDGGTFARMDEARDAKTTVRVPRSRGGTSDGHIIGSGHAGRGMMLKVHEGGQKYVPTEAFLAVNPWLEHPADADVMRRELDPTYPVEPR